MKNETKVGDKLLASLTIDNHTDLNTNLQVPPIEGSPYNLRILRSLRRIVRAIDLYSRELKANCGLTIPQLLCLSVIVREKQITAVSLSLQVHLSPSTLVGILDRLEKAGLIQRKRSAEDRRQVIIKASDAGKNAIDRAPSPLQENLISGLGDMPANEQAAIAHSLETIVALMEAHEIKVAPLLTLERKSYASRPKRHRLKPK